MAKSYFAENGIQYAEKNVMEDMTAQADMIQKSGQMGVPVIDINGTIVLGFDKPKIQSLLGL
jgi:glutaredoxin